MIVTGCHKSTTNRATMLIWGKRASNRQIKHRITYDKITNCILQTHRIKICLSHGGVHFCGKPRLEQTSKGVFAIVKCWLCMDSFLRSSPAITTGYTQSFNRIISLLLSLNLPQRRTYPILSLFPLASYTHSTTLQLLLYLAHLHYTP